MKSESKKNERVLLEYLGRSPRGLWIKAKRTEEAIEIFWKPRFFYEKGTVTIFDFNGEVEEKVHGSDVQWGDEWRSAGTIELVDEMVIMSGLEHFEEFVSGLMRHVVHLLTCGYGDNPGEVLGWFSDFAERKFIVEDQYRVIGSHGEIQDLEGIPVFVERSDDELLKGTLVVGGGEFTFDLNNPEILTSFIISTIPV